jgi:hypothetical protein
MPVLGGPRNAGTVPEAAEQPASHGASKATIVPAQRGASPAQPCFHSATHASNSTGNASPLATEQASKRTEQKHNDQKWPYGKHRPSSNTVTKARNATGRESRMTIKRAASNGLSSAYDWLASLL